MTRRGATVWRHIPMIGKKLSCLLCFALAWHCNRAHPEWEDSTVLALIPTPAGGSSTAAPAPATKRMFVTATAVAGHMGGPTGVAAADAICTADGNHPGGGTFKAVIVDGVARTACTTANCAGGPGEHVDWVLAANTQYVRASDSAAIMTTDANGVLVFGALTNTIATGGPLNYWTGLTNNWVLSPKHCTAWTNGTGGGPNTGQAGRSNATNDNAIRDTGFIDCAVTLRLLCAEQ